MAPSSRTRRQQILLAWRDANIGDPSPSGAPRREHRPARKFVGRQRHPLSVQRCEQRNRPSDVQNARWSEEQNKGRGGNGRGTLLRSLLLRKTADRRVEESCVAFAVRNDDFSANREVIKRRARSKLKRDNRCEPVGEEQLCHSPPRGRSSSPAASIGRR